LKFHLENKGLQAFVEYKVQTSRGGEHVPDIFVIGDEHTFIEEKGSLPAKKENFDAELSKILEYDAEHVHEGVLFLPQLVLMCPEDVVSARSSSLSGYSRKLCLVSFSFPVEDPIAFKRKLGKIGDEKLVATLSGKEKVPQSRTSVPKIKFLREKPPVPYSAWHIWLAMWCFSSPTNVNVDFKVEYSALLEHCRLFYPPWLSKESDQITQGRLGEALELLAYLGWVEFRQPLSAHATILVHFAKGDRLRSETFVFSQRSSFNSLSIGLRGQFAEKGECLLQERFV
jgi:hypothetical protein